MDSNTYKQTCVAASERAAAILPEYMEASTAPEIGEFISATEEILSKLGIQLDPAAKALEPIKAEITIDLKWFRDNALDLADAYGATSNPHPFLTSEQAKEKVESLSQPVLRSAKKILAWCEMRVDSRMISSLLILMLKG